MTEEINRLDSPIDVMFLIHKALSAEALRVEEMIREFSPGDTLQSFKLAFNEWARALMYHADIEDQYMTLPMTDFQPARDNEAEHAELHGLGGDLLTLLGENENTEIEGRIKHAMAALTEEQHMVLLDRLQGVMDVLCGEVGRGRVIPRTKRHLYGKVVELRMTQDDHLESEEAFVLQEVRDIFTDEQEYDLARVLLIDESSDDSNWVLDWMTKYLSQGEMKLLTDLLAERKGLVAAD